MKKAAKHTTSIIMLILLSVGLFPIQAFAWVTNEGMADRSLQVGVYVDLKIGTDFPNFLPVELASGSLPAGIQFIEIGGYSNEYYRIRGSALPGTVGDYEVYFRDVQTSPNGQRVKYTVNRGPQTTVCDNATVRIGGTVILSPRSKNGDGDVISAGSTDAPTYTFVSNDPGVATVDPTTGVVTSVSVGTATITISSAGNGSYLAATDLTVQVEVLPPPSSASDITSFSIDGVPGVINGNTITVTLPFGTDLTNLAPVITVSPGASVSPASGASQDFSTGSVTYTVTAADGSINTYTVSVALGSKPRSATAEVREDREDRGTSAVGYEKAIIGHCKEWANVRSGPGVGYDIVGRVYLGENIELLQWDKGEVWCKVLYNGGDNAGWVHGKFIIPQK